MAISIFVMPLGAWLRGDFAAGWPGGPPAPSRQRRSEEDVHRGLEAFQARLESLLGSRPDWDESGPIRSATTMSAGGFARPFLRARQWSYRLALPRLCALEPPQIWIPAAFDSVLQVAAPWSEEVELAVVSSAGVEGELRRLLEALEREPSMEELQELPEGTPITGLLADYYADLLTTRKLREIAALSEEHAAPVIIEG